jgi:hypothetical protein
VSFGDISAFGRSISPASLRRKKLDPSKEAGVGGGKRHKVRVKISPVAESDHFSIDVLAITFWLGPAPCLLVASACSLRP